MTNETLDLLTSRLADVEREVAPLNAEAERLRAAIDAVRAVDSRRPAQPTSRPPRAASRTNGSKPPRATRRAPRGENRAKILAATRGAPKTAKQIEAETGVPSATAASTMNTMARAGLLRKARRGYVAA
jgi:hypothetical protein